MGGVPDQGKARGDESCRTHASQRKTPRRASGVQFSEYICRGELDRCGKLFLAHCQQLAGVCVRRGPDHRNLIAGQWQQR